MESLTQTRYSEWQNPNFRGGQNRNSRWGQNQVSRGGQNGSRGGQIQKFFGATRRSKRRSAPEILPPPLEKILATPLIVYHRSRYN